MACNIFGIEPVLFTCSRQTKWDQLALAIKEGNNQSTTAQIVIVRNLDMTSRYLQGILLDVLMTKKVVVGGVNSNLSQHFILILITTNKSSRHPTEFLGHLKDQFLLRHSYDMESELNRSLTKFEIDQLTAQLPALKPTTLVSLKDVQKLQLQTRRVEISMEIKGYMQDIVVFCRTHRLVRNGISPKTVRDFDLLLRTLCVLNGYGFATPSLVKIAARKALPLKISIIDPQDEPSIRYGGDINLVSKWIPKWDADLIVDDVLHTVRIPA